MYHKCYWSHICLSLGFVLAGKADSRVVMLTMVQGSQSSMLPGSDLPLSSPPHSPDPKLPLLYWAISSWDRSASVITHWSHQNLSLHVKELCLEPEVKTMPGESQVCVSFWVGATKPKKNLPSEACSFKCSQWGEDNPDRAENEMAVSVI